ncbi:leucyl aminopeptidase [Candidatus Woesearchaeota archaeon]|nr:leucyl aminopeptidase [Candidatus Woesearchaeota archaeon]
MKLSVKKDLDASKKLLVLGFFSDDKDYYKDLNSLVHQKIVSALNNKTFNEKIGSTIRLMINDSVYDEVLVVSLGSSNDLSSEVVRRALSRGVNHCKSLRIKGFTTNIADLVRVKNLEVNKIGLACGESVVLSSYVFNKYSSKAKDNVDLDEVVFSWSDSKSLKKFSDFLNKGSMIGESTNFAKNLVNEPACVASPAYIESEAKKLAKNSSLSLKVFQKKDLEKLGMNLILNVGKGSDFAPRLLVLEYKGGSNSSSHVLVGKGITFDSGGYNIKPTGYIEDMKQDMAGAAAVLGTFRALTLLKPKISVSAIIPLAENMISNNAYRPGDIIKSHNGKSVEILNTDAEGRLILADALSYATKKYKGACFIDIATLTGAAGFVTGHLATPMIGNNNKLLDDLKVAGLESFDRVWELPFFEDYHEWMDSDVADYSNISKKFDRSAGVITGGVFLSKFVGDEKWVHLDIGGTAYLKEPIFYNQKYASGAGVRLLTYLLNKF